MSSDGITRRKFMHDLLVSVGLAAINGPACGPPWCSSASGDESSSTSESEDAFSLSRGEIINGPEITSNLGPGRAYPGAGAPVPVEYLVISSDHLEAAAGELTEFRRKDYGVEQIKVSEISNNIDSNLLREFLSEYSSNNPFLRYVVLVGGIESIPHSVVEDRGTLTPTDFFYSNVRSNGPLPDIALGRIPCSNADDLRVIINKIKAFRSRELNDILLFGQGPEIRGYGSEHFETLRDSGYNPTLIMKTGEGLVNRVADLENVIGCMNQGVDISIFYGHAGDPFIMYPFLEDYKMDSLGLQAELSNEPFVLMTGGCNNIDFTNDHPDLCIGYAFLKNENGGSIASMGCSRRAGFGYRYSFIDGFFAGVSSGMKELGDLIRHGLHYNLQRALEDTTDVNPFPYEMAELFTKRFTLLGDPALQLVE